MWWWWCGSNSHDGSEAGVALVMVVHFDVALCIGGVIGSYMVAVSGGALVMVMVGGNDGGGVCRLMALSFFLMFSFVLLFPSCAHFVH